MSLENIRLWEGSQERAFGELCFQLEYSEDNDSKTVRNAAPDGGIEFYKVLNDGREWGYQCKYFLKMGDSQWVQMDSSVKRAIATHRSLVKYVFMLPIDFPDPRIHRKKSARDKWNESVVKCEKWANKKGMKIELPRTAEVDLVQDTIEHKCF